MHPRPRDKKRHGATKRIRSIENERNEVRKGGKNKMEHGSITGIGTVKPVEFIEKKCSLNDWNIEEALSGAISIFRKRSPLVKKLAFIVNNTCWNEHNARAVIACNAWNIQYRSKVPESFSTLVYFSQTCILIGQLQINRTAMILWSS